MNTRTSCPGCGNEMTLVPPVIGYKTSTRDHSYIDEVATYICETEGCQHKGKENKITN